jgi:hypothetical protein
MFMNGVASLSRIITIGTEIFFIVQSLHWVVAASLVVVIGRLLLHP